MRLERLAVWYIKLRRRPDARWIVQLMRESLHQALHIEPETVPERDLLGRATTADKNADAKRQADATRLGQAVERYRRNAREGVRAWLRENRFESAAGGEDLLVTVAREVGETVSAFASPLFLPIAAILAILLLSRRE